VTAPLSVTLVVEAPLDADDYDRFAEAIGRHAGTPVRRLSGPLVPPAPDGFVVLAAVRDIGSAVGDCPPELERSLRRRIVSFASSPRDSVRVAEREGVAGVIDALSFLEWGSQKRRNWARGPVGLRSLGPAIGATCVSLFKSETHCLLESTTHDGLPHLLVDYLRAYDAEVLDRC
jgi:hypothetical protein